MRVGHVSLRSQGLLLPLGVPRMPAPVCSTPKLSQYSGVWGVLTTADVGNVTQGQGVPDHQVLPISAAQHAQAFCKLFQGFTAVGVPPTKALQWGLGSALQWVLPRPCGWGGGGIVPTRHTFFFEPTLFTPYPMGGHPTHLSTSGGFPPQKANMCVHQEAPTGILFQRLWHLLTSSANRQT